MSDCAYGSNSPLSRWDYVKMSVCAYGNSSPVGQVMSISKASLLLVRLRLANKSRLILVGVAVGFFRVLALATVVVVFSTVARVMADTSTELLHSTLQRRDLRGAFPAYVTQRVLVGLQVDPDLVYSMALSGRVGHYPDNRAEYDRDRDQGQYPDETDSHSNKNQPGLVR